ncbi:TonB-dependent receptor domain-containing protein [Polymorphobacter fuscus]|uniref:TonB-dependent receptor n=1 Tax=Sandarakinorhabdus fusca TaxID=1439888 RepID=A0A7C9KNY1_9SPHN|nr:TonB-dependent receptor [Polymorphobacter fuscus]KAB7644830.1 TonB-dependent receptor [Polymorphobacter fuscus]MQT18104.1 TonB-dependent receptor [Polymorphobacter fuscus]NJC09422.1 outer membrane receptor for ferrienterochelin and colicins [Polymorphobacter fuscus]
MLSDTTKLTLTVAALTAMHTPLAAQQAAQDRAGRTSPAADIVVTASGFEQKIVNAPASISVIGRAELETERFNNLGDALSDVEGVDVGGTAGKTGGLNVSIRGMPSDYTLVLLDGRRQNAPGNVTPNGFGETSTSFLPPLAAIERIEVVRGPMSTLYGSDAMGGVINIITRKVGDNWVGTATVDTTLQGDGDFGNTYSTNGFVQGPLVRDLVGLSVRGSYLRRDASNLTFLDSSGTPIEVSTRGPSPVAADIYSLGGRLSLTPASNHDLWVEYDRSHQRYDNSESQLGTGTVQGGYADELRFVRNQITGAHNWRTGFGTIESTLTRNTTETFGRTIPPGTPGATPGDPRALRATNTIADTRLVAETGPVIFTAGGQYWWARMADGVAPIDYAFDQWAVFGEASWKLLPGFTLTGGARYDRHTTFGGKVSPRGYAVWNVSDAVTIKGGVSRGFKTPRLDQITPGITGFGGQGTIPLIGTPGLRPETTTSAEVGVYFDTKAGLSGNVTLFNNEFDDKIAAGPGIPNCAFRLAPDRAGCLDVGNFPNVDLFGQTINIDKARTRGVETALRFVLSPALTLTANHTFTDSEQLSGPEQGLPLIGTPRHMANAQLRWKTSRDLSLWARGQVQSGRFRGTGAAQDALGDFAAYQLLHIGGNYRVNDAITLNAVIYNVFNTNFVEYLPYRDGTRTVYAQQYANNQEPRRLYLSVNVDF